MSNVKPDLTSLRGELIQLLDDYHEGGEFHDYTELEKTRYADSYLAKVTAYKEAAVREARIDELRSVPYIQGPLDEYKQQRLADLNQQLNTAAIEKVYRF